MVTLKGAATPLDEAGLQQALQLLQVPAEVLWAVLRVETAGCGYLADRRPQILFERHIFHRETQGKFDAAHPDISSPTPGGYAGGAGEYPRLNIALTLDPVAALRSASWGIGQIMGFNAELAGWPNGAGDMVAAMIQNEAAQLAGMARFVAASGMKAALQARDWQQFARAYNGPNFRENQYDTKLADAYAGNVANGMPDLRVRAVQVYLRALGYEVGGIDGLIGPRTRGALAQFAAKAGIAFDPALGDTTMQQLATAYQQV